ncbi:heterocyst differentiation protein HetZ [Spirulina major CS-329]|uniref:heterocyst differentiation protein HetZ n=1 Tax=Spirulina TaxID=1154 RepID=UPI00233080B9|nr:MULTISPECIES: heterocyst differentiation protein HetZ [Spirulina]MDB9495228.1 heterocyst differentiation protein HetZ [Spirulina subsalsa CS-330]MDB9503010.1 heterocyst differentiation protein HetZ [Spirulina major CS-329]
MVWETKQGHHDSLNQEDAADRVLCDHPLLSDPDVEFITQSLYQDLHHQTKATKSHCWDVAQRLATEVWRICQESQRIQTSGEVESWARTLAQHRLKQCLRYYKLGSKRGRVQLQSLLSSIVYRYILPPQGSSSYQGRVALIEDFLQGFYLEALNLFRRETELPATYTPRSLLQLAEYMAFCERYAKRRIPLPRRRSQQLIILRAQTFSQKQPPEASVDMDSAADGGYGGSDRDHGDPLVQQLRLILSDGQQSTPEGSLHDTVIDELLRYFEDRNQVDCADYFILRLRDLSAQEIEAILEITPRQRDYLQQRFKYHLIRFALSHRWELVHQWLGADLDHNLGLTPQEWHNFYHQLTEQQQQLLQLKQDGLDAAAIATQLSLTVTQTEKQWFKLLEMAWDIRNRSVS